MTDPPADFDYESTAAQINMSVAWLKKNIKSLPHQRYGKRGVRFTPDQIAEIRRRFEQRPSSPAPAGEGLRPARRRRAS